MKYSLYNLIAYGLMRDKKSKQSMTPSLKNPLSTSLPRHFLHTYGFFIICIVGIFFVDQLKIVAATPRTSPHASTKNKNTTSKIKSKSTVKSKNKTKKKHIKTRKGKGGIRWVKVPKGYVRDQELDLYQGEDQKPKINRKKRIRVRSFLMAQTEVTVAQYRRCVHAKVCPKPDASFLDDQCTWSDQPSTQESKPMNCVTREEALTFSKWVGGSLPSHAQWYHAARGGDSPQSQKPNDLMEKEWVGAKENEGPFKVAQKQMNPFGLYDVLGNVAEFIAPEKKHKHQSDDFLPCGCESIYFRGGVWSVPIEEIKYSIWNGINADRSTIFVGFRPVK